MRFAEMLVASDDGRVAEVFRVDERGIEPDGWLRLNDAAAVEPKPRPF